MTSPIHANFNVSRHESSRYAKGVRNGFKHRTAGGEATQNTVASSRLEDDWSDEKALKKIEKLEKTQFESPPNAAQINFEIKPVKALSLALKKKTQEPEQTKKGIIEINKFGQASTKVPAKLESIKKRNKLPRVGFDSFSSSSQQHVSLNMSSHKLKDGIFVRNLKQPVLKLEILSSKV